MSGWAIEVRAPSGSRMATAAQLVEWTKRAVEERPDGTLVSFAPTASDAKRLLARLADAVPRGLETSCTHLEDTDWSDRWREGLAPRRVGCITILPSWVHPERLPTGPTVVLDPGGAFGSGEHGSTRAALELLEHLVPPRALVLDLGSGSGILALAAVRVGARRAIGIELAAEAVAVAEANARRNRVEQAAAFIQGDARHLAALLGPADVIVANILRTVNTALLPVIHETLHSDGLAIFSGMEREEADSFLIALDAGRFDPVEQRSVDGWWAVAAARR